MNQLSFKELEQRELALKQYLIGQVFEETDEIIMNVFIAPADNELALELYRRMLRTIERVDITNRTDLTIVVAFGNGSIMSAKNFVEAEALLHLISLVEDLSYMQDEKNDTGLG